MKCIRWRKILLCFHQKPFIFDWTTKDMVNLNDMGVSKLSAKAFFFFFEVNYFKYNKYKYLMIITQYLNVCLLYTVTQTP